MVSIISEKNRRILRLVRCDKVRVFSCLRI